MNLEQLKGAGAFVGPELTVKTITWTHPDENGKEVTDTFDVRIRRLPYGDIERLLVTGFKEPDRSQTAQMISEAVRLGEDGEEVIPYIEAYRLDPALARALAAAVGEVNGTGEKLPKNSPPPTSSGTS